MSDDDRPHLVLAAVDGEPTVPVDLTQSDNLVEAIRIFADRVEEGLIPVDFGRAIVIIESRGRCRRICLGPLPTLLDAVALLELAKYRFMKDSCE